MIVRHRDQWDEPVFVERLKEIIECFPEMTYQRSLEEAMDSITQATASLDQWVELVVRDASGRLVGFAVATDDDDAHVGPCLGVQWRMVFPEAPAGTCMRLQRGLVKLARECNYKVMAYTHRTGEGRYEINYTKLKENPNGQENQEGR
ncbi:acetyltransferase [Pseudomonas phage QAC]|uniref:Acetyltransferase n=3 Tax=Ghunavirus TaxID=2732683 RepID=A0AAE7VK36_9CAUD|nr:putative GNAT family N-acetyltransferase [Pseudomonas phage 17A]QXV72578.1 acetyltransferase [Pseudomonas phage FRS]UAV89855.1 acetyltransferase [Pseudomonas phage QAC]